MTSPVSPSRFGPSALFCGAVGVFGVLGLSACGGGSDSPEPSPAAVAAAKASAAEYKSCVQVPPDGTVHTYANAARPHVEWKKATYAGELLSAQVEYVDPSRPLRILYTRLEPNVQTLVAQEVFDSTTGKLLLREQYENRSASNKLAAGETEAVNYTVHTLFPANLPDRTERQTRTFVGTQEATFGEGRLKTCVVTEAVDEAAIETSTRLSNATLHYVPGLNVVKRYDQATAAKAPARNQTILSELRSSTAAVNFLPDAAATQPALADCQKVAAGLDLVLTASNDAEAASARRRTVAGTFNNVPTLDLRRSTMSGELTQVRHLDAVLGYSTEIGRESYNVNGDVTARSTITGIPDLRNALLGQGIDYVRSTLTPPSAVPVGSPERFTFEGHKKITTPAGTVDTCQVRFDYGSSSETVYLVPNSHWVRLETQTTSGEFTTRELIKR